METLDRAGLTTAAHFDQARHELAVAVDFAGQTFDKGVACTERCGGVATYCASPYSTCRRAAAAALGPARVSAVTPGYALPDVVAAIRQSVEAAESSAGLSISGAYMGISGDAAFSFRSFAV